MLKFLCSCDKGVVLHFNAANASCEFKLFKLPDHANAIGTSPDHDGSWTYKIGAADAAGGAAYVLETETATVNNLPSVIRIKVDNGNELDLIPMSTINADHNAKGWKLGDAPSGQTTGHDIQIFCK